MSDIPSTIERNEITPLDAIADAMMRAYWRQLKGEISYRMVDPEKPELSQGMDEFLKSATRSECLNASVDTICALAKKHPDLFTTLTIISTEAVPKTSWLSKVGQGFHAYFLAQDRKGVWYAASPANHGANNEKAYALTLIKDNDLSSVLRKIEKRDGLLFPDEEKIKEGLNSHSRFPTVTDRFVSITEIRQTLTGVDTELRDFYSFM